MIILNDSDYIDIEVETYKKKLIEGINNGTLYKVIPYIKVKICEHFFHEKCKTSKKIIGIIDFTKKNAFFAWIGWIKKIKEFLNK